MNLNMRTILNNLKENEIYVSFRVLLQHVIISGTNIYISFFYGHAKYFFFPYYKIGTLFARTYTNSGRNTPYFKFPFCLFIEFELNS